MVVSSEAIGKGEGVEKVFAHLPERCCVRYSHDGKHVYTGGEEGQVFVYDVTSGLSMDRSERQRLHRGAIQDLAASRDVLASCGTDGSLVVYGTDLATLKANSKLVYRATLPLRSVSVRADGKYVACAGDSMEVVLVDVSDGEHRVAKSALHTRPITSLAFDPKGELLAAVDMAGTVRIYNAAQLTPLDDIRCTLPPRYMPKLAWSPDGAQLAITVADGIKLVGRDRGWTTSRHLILTDVHRETAGLSWSADGSLLVSHDMATVALWSVRSGASKPYATVTCESSVLCFDLSPDMRDAVFIDKEGQLNRQPSFLSSADLLEITKLPPAVPAKTDPAAVKNKKGTKTGPGKKKKKRSDLKALERKYISQCKDEDSNEEDDGGDTESMPSDEGGSVDLDDTSGGEEEDELDGMDLDSLDDYDVDEPVDRAAEDQEKPQAIVTGPPTLQHPPFQPGATDTNGEHSYLAWNLVGIITSRKDDVGYRSVDIEFHDKLGTRPIRFTDDYGYTLGSLSRTAAIFATRGAAAEPAVLHYIAFETWGGRATWTVRLDAGEQVVGVAVDERAAYVATSHGWLRVFSPAGLAQVTLTFGGELVTVVAGAGRLLLVLAQHGHLLGQVYTVGTGVPVLAAEGPLGRRADTSRLLWAGISEGGLVGCFDQTGVLYVLCDRLGFCWTPIADYASMLAQGTTVWPVFFDRSEISAVLCKNGETQPAVLPRPIPSPLPMKLPMLEPDDPGTALYEPVLRTALLGGRLVDGTVGLREKDQRRLHTASDKHVLELIQLALKGDKPARVLELCNLLYAEKSYELALQLCRHHRLLSLADRIGTLKSEFVRRRDSPLPESGLETPKLPVRIQRESPSVLLASLTPTDAASSLQASTLEVEVAAAASPSASRPGKRVRMDLIADSADMAADQPEAEASIPDAGLEPVFETLVYPPVAPSMQPAERKPKGLADMLSRLSSMGSGTLPSAELKKASSKENEAVPQPAQKSLKQASLASMFSRKASTGKESDAVAADEAQTQMP